MKRTIMLIEMYPERTPSEKMAMMHSDIKDAVDLITTKLHLHAQRYHPAGWTDDPAGITFDTMREGTGIVGRLELERPDDD